MDTIQTALKLIQSGCFMASVDLKDAYYSISVAEEHQTFLKLYWEDCYFQFTYLPNGLACAQRLFTKVLKPVYAHIRSMGHICMGHIDDSLIVGYDYTACKRNIHDTVHSFRTLGFIVHPEKSILEPRQEIVFLGFLLSSMSTTIRLPLVKASYVKTTCENLLSKDKFTIREFAHVIGLIVSSLPGVQFGELHYRNLEINKTAVLQCNSGDYDASMYLTDNFRSDMVGLTWWAHNITTAYKYIAESRPDFTLTTDQGLGSCVGGK